MAKTLTAAGRKSLIRLASTLPVGSPERRAILAGLTKTAGRKVTIESEDGQWIVYMHGLGRSTGLTPPVPLRQAKEIASIVRGYPKNMTAEQIGSELYRSFFS